MKSNFETETREELLKETETNVFVNPISHHSPDSQLGIEKVILGDEFTRIDFVYISSRKYINGGWIQIDAGCFIRPIGSEVCYKMIRAINIPIAPAKYHFKSKGQVHHFSLIYPAIPKNVSHIDVIEKLDEGPYFNFFGVALQHNQPTLIRIINEN